MGSTTLMILAAVLGFLAVAGVGMVFAGGGGQTRTVKRAQAIGERTRTPVGRARSSAPDPAARRKQILKTLKEQDRRQRKVSFSLTARLQQAGLNITTKTFWIVSAVMGGLAFLIALGMRQSIYVGLALLVGVGLGLPRWVIGFLATRRSKKFIAGFADASDIIVRGIKSGLPLNECLNIIGRESPEPLASEFQRMVEGVAHGMTLEQGLEKMFERMPIAELRFFGIVLGVQQKTGGNLAEALGNLSAVLRSRKLMREKVKALASEATASAMIIGSLPPIVVTLIYVTTPSYLQILFTDPRGKLILLVSGLWMALGIFVMKRMINFKF